MPARAIIIGIESYAQAQGMAQQLDGTIKAALEFRDWLTAKWIAEGVTPEDAAANITFCSEPKQPGGLGAMRTDILRALRDLKIAGKDQTEELYFYFSGHGFSFVEASTRAADIILAADFEEATFSGHCCFKMDDIVAWLRGHMGPGQHIYFINACRNPLEPTQITPMSPIMPWDQFRSEEAAAFILPAAAAGSVTAVDGPFHTALLEGLKGKGKAKVWGDDPEAMIVTFAALAKYVAKVTGTRLSPMADGDAGAVLATIKPVPQYRCSLIISNHTPTQLVNVTVKRGRGTAETVQLQGPQLNLMLEPDFYLLTPNIPGVLFEPASRKIDLFDDDAIPFTKLPPSVVAAPTPMPEAAREADASVNLVVPRNAELLMRREGSLETFVIESSETRRLPQGRYMAEMRDARNFSILSSEHVEVHRSGAPLMAREAGLESMSSGLSGAGELGGPGGLECVSTQMSVMSDGSPLFSESLLDSAVEHDLDVWLALVGGGTILTDGNHFRKIHSLPLRSFLAEPAGTHGVWILASVDAEAPQLQAGERTSVGTTWQQLQPTDVTSVADLRLTPTLGSSFLSLRLGQADRAQTVTLATWTFPNFITLITVTSKPDGQLNLCQYILPMGQHQGQLTPEQQVGFDFTERQLLPDMLFRARLERTFRQRRDLWRTLSDAQLEALRTGQWTDPVASPLVAYALARRGRTREIPPIAAALAKAYPTHPDIPALLAICGGGDPASAVGYGSGLSIPLFLDGLRALPYSICPLPLSHLEASGPWSTWQLGRQS